ncbi:MAG: response regulator [Oligosphaeraceae bacterium]
MPLPPLSRTARIWLACLLAYLLLLVLLVAWRVPGAAERRRAALTLTRLQEGWRQELLLAQMAMDAQRNGRTDRRAQLRETLNEEQSRQSDRLQELSRMGSALPPDALQELSRANQELDQKLLPLTEARDHSRQLDELQQLFAKADARLLQVQENLHGNPWLAFLLALLWPLPLLAAAAWAALSLWRQRELQRRTLGNYLSLPTGQLLEGATSGMRQPGPGEDPFLGQGLEELLRRVRKEAQSRERFIATMSHEIRTPMNGLLGFLSSLQATQLNDQQRQYLRIIDASAKGLTHVINEILDFTKLRAGKLAPSPVTFDLRTFAQERVDLARQAARRKSLRVQLDFPGEGPLLLRTDPSLLRQVLDNLLGNGVKFTEHGEVVLELRVSRRDDGDLEVNFAVRDSGIGMTHSEQEHLFRPYEQAGVSIARRYGGTGLGLTISHALVELLGGDLQVKSNPGEGSCFFFTLRCQPSKPEEQVHLSDLYHVKLPRAELKKHWALLVDDTLTNLFLLETICQSVGLPYRTAENGREALELCRQQHFDLIFMDIQMPIMDGYTAIREIRKLPDAATTAIVALTASAYQEDVEKALGAGSTGFIPKPFERDQLLLCIADALGIAPERELRDDRQEMAESPEVATVRRMHNFMREQYQLSLGEIKMLLAQTLTDWRPLLDNLGSYAQQGNAQETLALLHRLKGMLAAIGLLEHSEKTVSIMEAFREGRKDEGQTMLLGFIHSLTRIFKLLESDVTIPA